MRRLRLMLLALSLLLALPACTSKPPSADNSSDTGKAENKGTAEGPGAATGAAKTQAQKQPVIVPAGATITIRLGSALGSKLSKAGQTFAGSVAKDIAVENEVAIPQGTGVRGIVLKVEPLGKLAGEAVLQLRIDSININSVDVPVQAGLRTFSIKGKGKRTGILAGGGAALGAIFGGLKAGGKGAAIGAGAGGGAGTAGAAATKNKEVVLPAEATVSFQLKQALEITP